MKAILAVLALLCLGSMACPPGQPNDIGCAFCKIGFATIEDLLTQNSTEEAIAWALGQICNLFPEPQKTSCHKVVDYDIKYIIQMVKKVESPEEICCQLGACPGPCPVIDVPCAMCEFLLTDVDRWIKDGKGKAEIEEIIDAWCTILPSSAQVVCKKITDIGIGTLIDMIIKYQDPHTVCSEIALCNETAIARPMPPPPSVMPVTTGDAACQWCKIGFATLEELLSQNFTESGIEYILGFLCNFLPEPQKTACHTVVLSDIKTLIEAIKKFESPEELCCQIGTCPNTTCPIPPEDVGCQICQFLIKQVDKWLQEGKGEDEIAHLIEAWCTILPESAQPVCKVITDVGIKTLIEMAIKYEDPHRVCYEIKSCPTPARL